MNAIVFAQAAEAACPEWLKVISSPDTMVFVVAIVGIIVGGLVAITKNLIRHRERMAMIEQGMNPDHPAAPLAPPPGRTSR